MAKTPTNREILIVANPDELNHRAAQEFISQAGKAIQAKGFFTVVLSGGSTPRGLYTILHCAQEGQKLQNIRANPNVCFEVEDVKEIIVKQPTCASSVAYRSVILFGNIKILSDLNAKNYAIQKLADKYAPQNPKVPFTEAMLNRTNVLEIEIKEMTAKRSPVKPAITDPSNK